MNAVHSQRLDKPRGCNPWAYFSTVVVATFAFGAGAAAQTPAPPTAEWPLETITLSDGTVLHGLIEPTGPATIEFVAVHRPPGKPMSLVITPIERKNIASMTALDSAERRRLRERINQFRNRASIESRRMDDITLTPIERDGVSYLHYEGDWFSLDSTADETTTRRAIVRIEQMFTAYRQILPARAENPQPTRIVLFGSNEQYGKFMHSLGLSINNPAFFAADANLVAAGADINRLQAAVTKATRAGKAAKKEFDKEYATLPERLKKLAGELRSAGRSAEDQQGIVSAEQKKWDEQKKALSTRFSAAERRNAAQFNRVMSQMFARLYHEAFHAYLEGSIYPRAQHDVPRWLNEGLAQVFESGLLEVDTLRVDAPSAAALAELKRDLEGGEPLPLAEVLTADSSVFLPAHSARGGESSRLYLYSWGLAYYLTFDEPLLGTSQFDEYVRKEAVDEDPVARFEKLVGTSLPEFEARWRKAMVAKK